MHATVIIATSTVFSGWGVFMSDGSDINTACLFVSKVITVMGLTGCCCFHSVHKLLHRKEVVLLSDPLVLYFLVRYRKVCVV